MYGEDGQVLKIAIHYIDPIFFVKHSKENMFF
jgi:hypothetical protein